MHTPDDPIHALYYPRNPRIASTLAAFVLLALAPAVHAATPIDDSGTPTSLADFSGAAVKAHPIRAKKPPQNPSMAPNGTSNVHNDSWMSDVYWNPGPLGRNPTILSASLGQRICVSITFDRKGRLIATCSNLSGPILYMFDPATLDVLAQMTLPFVAPPPGQDPFQNSSGGTYFYLDRQDRAVIGTADKHVWIVAETKPGPGFVLEQD